MAELIDPSSILDMSQSDLEALILTIRERRNRVTHHRSIAHHRSRASGVLALRPKLEKLALRLDKAIVKLDAQLARCEGMVREMVAMRLELGDATPEELANELRAAGTLNVVPPTEDEGDNDSDADDQVLGSRSDHDEGTVQGSRSGNNHGGDTVQGSQERPHQGAVDSESL